MRSISILEQLLAIVRPDDSPAPSMQVAEHGDGLLLTLAPSDISPEDRDEVWRAFAVTLTEELNREVPEMRVRVIPPGDGLAGLLQYSYPRQSSLRFEERIYWEAIVAALPAVEAITNARLVERYKAPARANTKSIAPPSRAAQRPPTRRRVL